MGSSTCSKNDLPAFLHTLKSRFSNHRCPRPARHAAPFRRKALFETLEGRLLLSGDPLPEVAEHAVEASAASALTATPTISWVGSANGFWDEAANWRDALGASRLPSASDDVAIDVASANPTITVRSSAAGTTARSLAIGESLIVAGGTLSVGGDLEVGTAGSFRLAGGTLSQARIVAGSEIDAATGTLDRLRIAGSVEALALARVEITGGLTFESGGVLELGTAGANRGLEVRLRGDQSIEGPGEILMPGIRNALGSDLLIVNGNVRFGAELTVRGNSAGIIFQGASGTSSLQNEGTIISAAGGNFAIGSTGYQWRNAAGGRLIADGGTLSLFDEWRNDGSIQIGASASSILNLDGRFTTAGIGTYARAGGTINVFGMLDNSGATLALNAETGSWNLRPGGLIKGGTITTAGGAQLVAFGGTLDAITLAGEIVFSSSVSIVNGITLAGDAQLRLSSGGTDVDFAGDETIKGNGGITIGAGSRLKMFGNASIDAGITLTGNGSTLLAGSGTLINKGNIRAEGAGMFIGGGTTTTFVNEGELSVTGSQLTIDLGSALLNRGTMKVVDATFNSGVGTLTNEGTIAGNNATFNLSSANVFLAPGGTLTNPGSIINLSGHLRNAGRTLTIDDTLGLIFLLDGGSITGGTIVTTGTNVLQVLRGRGILDGVTLRGTVDQAVPRASVVNLVIVNGLTLAEGVIRLGFGSTVRFEGTQRLGGHGRIEFTDANAGNRMLVANAGSTLTIGADVEVRGVSGKIDATGAAVLNEGTISAEGGGTISVIGAANYAANTLSGGHWHAKGNGTLWLPGTRIETNGAEMLLDGARARVLDDANSSGLRANLAAGKLTLTSGASLHVDQGFDNAGAVAIGTGAALIEVSRQVATTVLGFSSQSTSGFAVQALGSADTFVFGDTTTAWRPDQQNRGMEFLTLGFAAPVRANGVTMRETLGNGFVRRIEVLDTSDVLHTVWSGTDPSLPGTPVDFVATWEPTPYLVKGVRIHIDTTHSAPTWEAIDAVQLHGVPSTGVYRQSGGRTQLAGGRLSFGGGVELQAGVLSAAGVIDGDLVNAARVAVGAELGVLEVHGDYAQSAAGSLDVELAGTAAGTQHDQLRITGAAQLDGTLNVQLAEGFGPAAGQSFEILRYASAAGSFAIANGLKVGFKPVLAIDQQAAVFELDAIADAPDLDLQSVTIPPAGRPGEALTVTYSVKNNQTTAATGGWFDSIYLSASPVFDESALLLGRVRHVGDVAGGASYSETLTEPLPTLRPGHYRVFVLADSRGSIPDIDRSNNLGTPSGVVNVGVPLLSVGTPSEGMIEDGEDIYYRLVVPPGQDIDIAAIFGTAATAEVYVRYDALPDRSTFDLAATDLSELAPKLSIENASGGDYYILLHGREGAGSGRTYSLRAEASAFEITKYSPHVVSNKGDATVKLTGSRFTENTRVRLITVLGVVYAEADVTFADSQHISATFHLKRDEVPTGFFNVQAIDHGQIVTAADPLEVAEGLPGAVSMAIMAPAAVRVGQPIPVTIRIDNGGGTDAPAPIIELKATNVAETQKRQQFFGTGEEALPGMIPAGFVSEFGLIFDPVPKAAGTTSNFDLIVANPSTTLIDWDAQKEAYRPSYVSAPAWDAVWANFRPRMGHTLADFYRVLQNDARAFAQFGNFTNDIHDLVRFELEKAANTIASLALATGSDLFIPAPVIALSYDRAFGSSLFDRFRVGRLGVGWTDTYDIEMTTDADGLVTLRKGSNMRFFGKLENGSYLGFPGETATLAAAGDDVHLREADGSIIAFTADGNLKYIEDTRGNRISAHYTGAKLSRVTHSDGGELSFVYNAAGFVAEAKDSSDRTVAYAYDDAGHLVSVTTAQGETMYTYSTEASGPRAHALTSITTATGDHVFYGYDSQGRLARQELDGGAEALSYIYGVNGFSITNALGQTSSIFFDHDGRWIAMFDATGRSFHMRYDESGNQVEVSQSDAGSANLSYDALGNPTAIVDPLGGRQSAVFDPTIDRLQSFTDAIGNSTAFVNDAHGDVTSIVHADGSREQLAYDADGSVVQTVSRNGRSIAYTYDAAGLVLKKTYDDGTHIDYAYDAHHNLVSATDASGETVLTYDAADRLTDVVYPNGRGLHYAYDAGGRLTQLRDQGGFEINYGYDAAGRLASATDASSNVIVNYAYDAIGRLSRESHANGTYTTYEYAAGTKLLRLIHFAPDDSVRSRYEYAYDTLGRPISMTTLAGKTEYGYDGAGRLISIVGPDARVVTYEYDAAGNRIAKSDNGTKVPYAINNLNQYTAIGGSSYAYDGNGNVATGGVNAYTYDAEGRIASVSGPDGDWSYRYDAFGNRVAATHDGITTEYLVDPSGLGGRIAEYDDDGKLIAHYTYGIGLASRVDAAGSSAHYAFDAVGNTVALTGSGGSVLNTYRYLPFGETLERHESISNPFTFNGAWGVAREGGGLYDMRARSYDPVAGRFVQPDPIGLRGGANLYTYASNAPTAFADPSGLLPSQHPTFQIFRTGQSASTKAVQLGERYAEKLNQQLRSEKLAEQAAKKSEELATRLAEERFSREAAKRAAFATSATGIAFEGSILTALAVEDLAIFWSLNSMLNAEIWGRFHNGQLPPCPTDGTGIVGWGLNKITICDDVPISSGESVGTASTTQVGPLDPNEIFGPAGFGPERYMQPRDMLLPYVAYFENDPKALAPAQNVIVTEQLDADLDWSTFQFGDLGFGSTIVEVPVGLQFYSTRVDLSDTPMGLFVDISCDFDAATGKITWTFVSLDPDTLDAPADPFAGFLPPDNDARDGEGFATYFVKAKPALVSGTRLEALATIVFDTEAAIDTPLWVNTIDAGGPLSSVASLPGALTSTDFTVSWSGADDAAGSGIASYEVFVSDNGGPFTAILTGTTLTSASFSGEAGHSYAFYSVATDNVGHREGSPLTADATTIVRLDGTDPVAVHDAATTREATVVSIDVLANDTDADGALDPTTLTVVSQPDNGSASVDAVTGRIVYTPSADFFGVDSLRYTVEDSEGNLSHEAVLTVSVVPATQRVLGLPDFMRGPGQDVDVPATGTGLPLRLSDGAGVREVAFELHFDPGLLTITSAHAGAGAPTGASVTMTQRSAGVLHVVVNAGTAFAAGPIELAELEAAVPVTATYGVSQHLDLAAVSINGLSTAAADSDDGLHLIGYFGDANADRAYTRADVDAVQRVITRYDAAFSAYAGADPKLIADINADGRFSAVDATRLLQEVNFLTGVAATDRPEIPAIPENFTAANRSDLEQSPSAPLQTMERQPGLLSRLATALQRLIAPSNLSSISALPGSTPPIAGLETVAVMSGNMDSMSGSAKLVEPAAKQAPQQRLRPLAEPAGSSAWKRAFVGDGLGLSKNPNSALQITLPSARSASTGGTSATR